MKLSLKLKASSILALTFLIVYMLRPVEAQAPVYTTLDSELNTETVTIQNTQQTINQSKEKNNILYENVESNVPKNLNTLSQNVITQMLATSMCLLVGVNPVSSSGECLGINSATGKLGFSTQGQGGAIGFVGKMIAFTYEVPASSADFAVYTAANFGLTKNAYAQQFEEGVGFGGLRPLLKVWQGFRNMAYLLIVIMFTVIGLAIMFRVKVDARTVMSIQNQIPKIIIALILVTFSYAIAGFLIDLMYVSIYFILIAFNQVSPHSNPSLNINIFSYANKMFAPDIPIGGDFLGIISITWNVSKATQQIITSIFESIIPTEIGIVFRGMFGWLGAFNVACNLTDAVGIGGILKKAPLGIGGMFSGGCNFFENYPAILIGAIGQLLAFVVVLVAILYTLFKVWFMLLKAYLYVLLDVILAPFWIILGILPGSSFGFGKWLRHLTAQLAMFPSVIAFLLLGKTIMDAISLGGLGSPLGKSEMFAPPLIGNLGGNNALAAMVGLGVILSIPQLMDKVKAALQAPNFGLTAIKQSLNAGNPLSLAGRAGSMGYQYTGLKSLPVVGSLFKNEPPPKT